MPWKTRHKEKYLIIIVLGFSRETEPTGDIDTDIDI